MTYNFRSASSSSSSDFTSTFGRLTIGSKWISGLAGASSVACLSSTNLLSITGGNIKIKTRRHVQGTKLPFRCSLCTLRVKMVEM